MRYLLTGDTFDAEEALRIGIVQEVVAPGRQLDRAIEIAETIAAHAEKEIGKIPSSRYSRLTGS